MSMDFTPGTFDAARKCWMFTPEVESVNCSNSNAREIIEALGFQVDEEDGCMNGVEIDLFITRCQSYLRNHLGKPDPERPVVIERSRMSMQFEALCSQHGNVMGKLQEMFLTPGVPVVEVTRNSGGPTMIDCGRPEGYLQDRIRRILGVMQEAKRLGATHAWAS